MTSNEVGAREEFLAGLLAARSRSGTFAATIWTSRWALLQWAAIFFVFALFFGYAFGAAYVPNVVAAGVGLLLGLVVSARRGQRTWPWLANVIDWGKVESELSQGPENGA